MSKEMQPGYCTEVKFIRTVDGDTIEVELSRRFKIRVNNIDAPEKNTDEGFEAALFVDNLFRRANKVMIRIDTGDTLKLMDIHSFDRIVADVEVDGRDLREILIEKGFV
jgi:endonuclease YncB( thermonuclease family)